MAQKRMFDKAIIDTDKFMDLSLTSKAIYFLLGMEADDEGFVSYKKVMRIHGGNEDDVKVLVAKNFLILFPSGVVVITDWNRNNYLDKNRIKETEYQKEKKDLVLTKKGKYELNIGLTSIEENSIEESRVEENSSATAEPGKTLPSKEIVEIIKKMESVDPKNKLYYRNKTQRSACQFLIENYEFENVIKIIDFIISNRGKLKYLPSITTPCELRDKWQKIGDMVARNSADLQEKLNNVII